MGNKAIGRKFETTSFCSDLKTGVRLQSLNLLGNIPSFRDLLKI